MTDSNQEIEADERPEPQWKPLSRDQRRVVGVLIEKSKTTPTAYPMTLNAITTACNQKSNRFPVMSLSSDEVEDLLYELRELGAIVEVQGTGRTEKYRHNMYDWMGIEKVEMAVMGELLLRGEQTLGELRGRAARMNPIADIAELKPIVANLIEKGLVQALTPEGRGQIVTHNMYEVHELEKVESRAQSLAGDKVVKSASPTPETRPSISPSESKLLEQRVNQLTIEVGELRELIEQLNLRLEQLEH